MNNRILDSQSLDSPPADLSAPLQALWWLKKGELQLGDSWVRAHEICQTAEGTSSYDLVHALAHLIEGDQPNAAYWYRSAGVPQSATNVEEEWRAIVAHLTD